MVLTTLTTFALLVRSGMVALDVLVFAAYVAVCVALPGIFTWRLLLRRLHVGDDTPPTWFEDLSLGAIFGFGLQLPVYIVGLLLGVPLLVLALPVVVLVLSATPFGRRVWTMPTARLDWRASWVLSGVFVYGLSWLATNVFTDRPMWLPPNRTPSVDETFHQALVAELSHRFPPEAPFLLGTRLDYHWFVHAQIATARWVTHIDSVVMLRQLMPALTLLLTVLGLAAVALRLTKRPSAAVIAPALLVAGGFNLLGPRYPTWTFLEPFMSQRYISSPSQSYGVMVSLPALMLIVEVLRPQKRPNRAVWVALALALLALSGAKATFMPLFLCGAIAVWVIHLVAHRAIDRTVSALVGLLFATAVFAQVVLFGGQSGAMSFVPMRTVGRALSDQGLKITPTASIIMGLTLLVSWLLYGVGAIGLIPRGRWRDARALWMLVAISAGITIPFLFFRSGLSQLWFQRSVAELVVLISAWGLSFLLPTPLTRRQALTYSAVAAGSGLTAFVASSVVASTRSNPKQATLLALTLTVATPLVITAVFLLVRLAMGRADRLRPPLVFLVCILLGLGLSHVFALGYDTVNPRQEASRHYRPLFAAGGVDAAEFLRDNSSPDDVAATNIHCLKPSKRRCDNRNFWVSAYTERRVLIEGWGYTAVTNAEGGEGASAYIPAPDLQRLAINDAAFQYPSEVTVGRLVDTYGVDWLFVSKDYPADVEGLTALTSMLDKSFENSNYVVYEVIG